MSLQLAAASYIYIYYVLKQKRKGLGRWQRQLYTNREVYRDLVCWQTGIFGRSVVYIRISPECLPVILNF
jgi:hypothetical protein